jgi:uncharacterized protein DUF2154/cell wall-active antibiotic response 4TMS protein YvqF
MGKNRYRQRSSITGALIVIAVGVFLLILNMKPGLDAWSVISRYWPVAIILIGLGKIWEAFAYRNSSPSNPFIDSPNAASNLAAGSAPGGPSNVPPAGRASPPTQHPHPSAMPYVVLVIVVLLCVAMWRSAKVQASIHDAQSIELGAAKTVSAILDLPAGKVQISGGADSLLSADFNYRASDGKPTIDYSVQNDRGDLSITQQNESHIHFATTHNDWQLRFADNVPLDLDFSIGAGEGNIDLRGLDVRNLTLKGGVGEINLDLTGPRKNSLEGNIKGGIGSVNIRLPKDVGVRVHAKGGIGSVFAHGLTERDDEYTNSATGKSAATINLEIEGGIGKVDLTQEP